MVMRLIEALEQQVENRKSDVVGLDAREEGDIRIAQRETTSRSLRIPASIGSESKP